MLVQRILKFITDLNTFNELSPCDLKLYTSLKERFLDKDPLSDINGDDFNYIVECYAYRWQQTVDDSEYDYTFNPVGINQEWVEFAKELAPFIEKNYLYLLIPVITNSTDYNNLSLLSETTRLENFYLGQDSKTLYRKRGLCEHLISKNFKLSTCRDLHTRKLSPMTIEELSRLQACKQTNGAFSIESEGFSSFWDFLQKKVFIRLYEKGEVPISLIQPLFGLIKQYYQFKIERSDFSLFKKAFNDFLSLIYLSDLDNINYLYGVKIQYKGTSCYLFELLISIHKSQSYDLNLEMSSLSNWLLLLLKTEIKEAHLNQVKTQNDSSPSLNLSIFSSQVMAYSEDAFHSSLSLVLSLLTTKFKTYSLTERTISLWDKKNTVFPDAFKIHSILLPFLEANKPDELVLAFQNIMKDIIIPAKTDSGFLSWMFRYSSTDKWYNYVESKKFSDMAVYWFAPELLFQSLLDFNITNTTFEIKINSFLDELIHTYAQKSNIMLKMLRVNIIFSEFMNEFNSEDQIALLDLLRLYDEQNAKINFLYNAIAYIGRRLSQIENQVMGNATSFFSKFYQVDNSKHLFSAVGLDNVSSVINGFKLKLHSSDLKVEDKTILKMKEYLNTLMLPILSVTEKDDVESSVRTLDDLNNPT